MFVFKMGGRLAVRLSVGNELVPRTRWSKLRRVVECIPGPSFKRKLKIAGGMCYMLPLQSLSWCLYIS